MTERNHSSRKRWQDSTPDEWDAATATLRGCVCRRCSDGVCGVETTTRDMDGRPYCTACMKGEPR